MLNIILWTIVIISAYVTGTSISNLLMSTTNTSIKYQTKWFSIGIISVVISFYAGVNI